MKKFSLEGREHKKIVWKIKGDTSFIDLENAKEVKVINPEMKFFGTSEKNISKSNVTPQAYLISNECVLDIDSKNVSASGNVRIVSEKEDICLYTEQVFYDHTKELFYSDAYVKIERADSVTEGQGFDATLDLSEINIKNNVNIYYKSK